METALQATPHPSHAPPPWAGPELHHNSISSTAAAKKREEEVIRPLLLLPLHVSYSFSISFLSAYLIPSSQAFCRVRLRLLSRYIPGVIFLFKLLFIFHFKSVHVAVFGDFGHQLRRSFVAKLFYSPPSILAPLDFTLMCF